MTKRRLLAVLMVVGVLVLPACGDDGDDEAGGGSGGGEVDSDISIEVVTHGQASDSFWSVVKNGLEQAGKDSNVKVNYSAPDTFDMVKMSQLIDAAVAKDPDGLIVSVPDYDALKDSLASATDAGIPIITMNSGSESFQDIGAITHVGQDETAAGEGAGQQLADAGTKNVICVNQEVGNSSLDDRCNGAKAMIEDAGGKLEVVQVDLKDAAGAQSTVKSKLQQDSSIDGVLTLGPTGAAPALAALEELGKTGQIKLATFDLSPEVLDAITAGDMEFAVDQQQYLQGYLSVTFMALNIRNLNTVGGGDPVATGPGFVTKETAEKVKDLSSDGTR
jgi:simple sugar transport system substrate-binding protein